MLSVNAAWVHATKSYTPIKKNQTQRWPTPPGSPQRAKVDFSILQGAHSAGAVAVVASTGACPTQTPAYIHDNLGSAIFVANTDAAAAFEAQVLAPFFAKLSGGKFTAAGFGAKLTALKAKQLGASLRLLKSASVVDVFSITVTTKA